MARREYTDADVADVLEKAREKMNDEGVHWIKGAYRKFFKGRGQCYCSSGAIRSITRSNVLRDQAFGALAKGLPQGGKHAENKIIRWNDSEVRTWKDVDNRFRKTVERLRSAA